MLLLAASPLTHPSDADDQAEGFKRVKDRITIVVITNAAGYFDVSTTFFAFHFESNRIQVLPPLKQKTMDSYLVKK